MKLINTNQDSEEDMHSLKNQELEFQLLQADLPALLNKYKSVITNTVNYFVSKGLFELHEKEDIIQSVNESLLTKGSKIRTSFIKGKKVSSYLNVIIKNICLEIYRKKKRNILVNLKEVEEIDKLHNCGSNSLNQLTIQEEIKKLDKILKGLRKDKWRTHLFFKLLCRIPLKEVDITNAYPECEEMQVFKLLGHYGRNYQLQTDKDIYEGIATFENGITGKNNNAESIKKWINYKVQSVIRSLNKQSKFANYDKECLKILLSIYFSTTNS